MGRIGGEEATADEREKEREKQKLGIDPLSLFEESETILTRREGERGRDERLLNRSATRTGGERREFSSSLGTSFLGRFFQHLD